ncbi:gluconate 5-dehydrogenase [Luteitalea sp. TBR-22]|uniref:SDR family NAD(P)-dependent oxidoreductase n=1 Tax=Luteitalea sp. TBR-22 TaxID=2802971 RepID=UPI001AF3791D|nr:SDR family oxidoreductase [Luteitalea sp. TBR-22]BCS34245.1 gluconate 5-dehydrogenase [Luteitalea sp. TBR-22]
MSSLRGHRALITGATQGVGRAIAVAMARAGADLVLHGLRIDAQAEQTRAQCLAAGVQVAMVEGDLSSQPVEAATRLARDAHAAMPGIDLLVNNAGAYLEDAHFLDVTPEAFARTMRLNVEAPFFLTQQYARRWVAEGTQGRVLFTGSINGRLAEQNHAAYDTSKGAVEMMVKTLCVALAPHGIRVNGMAPGLVRTPLTDAFLSDPKAMAWMQMHTPNGAVPGPDVCGDAAVFLLSDGAWHVHGQMLLVDGGMSAWQQPDVPA